MWKIMRLSAFFLFLFLSQVWASTGYSQLTKLTLKMDNVKVVDVLDEIENKSDFYFVFNQKLVDVDRMVNVDVKNKSISSILSELFSQTGVTHQVKDNLIILTTEKSSIPVKAAAQQQQSITGKVVDDKGESIPGVSVHVKGTTSGGVTNLDGVYNLVNVKPEDTLVFSFVGMQTIEVVVGNQSTINVTLTSSTIGVDEVIVTALGIKKSEKALGYSVQKVSGEDLVAVKGVDVASSLTGKIAGLSVNNSSEISETPEIKLRGENPLIVIDGVAYGNITMHDVSAEDIESIDVLKGATASALYGVRGRAGAIMITTKKGKEGKLTINISNNTMFTAGYLTLPEAQHSYSTGNAGILEYNSGYVWGDYMDGHMVNQYDPITKQMKEMPLLPRGKDNISNFFRAGKIMNTNVSVSQAGKLGGFRVSGTQIHQIGQYPNSKQDKYFLTSSGYIEKGKFRLDAGLSYKNEHSPNMPRVNYGGGNILYNMLIWGGTEIDIRQCRDYWKVKDRKQNWAFDAWYDNPYFLMYERINERNKDLFNTNITMTYEIKDNISAMFRSGYDTYNTTGEYRQSIGDSGARRGYYSFSEYSGSSFNNDFIMKGDFKWSDIQIDAIAGLSSYWYKDISFSANTRGGLSVPGFYSLNASVERPSVSKSVKEKALYSAYGKLGLSWKSGIYVDITGRNDWSSTLPSSSRSYFYPSVAVSFIPTAFYNPFEDVLDFWKIRSSWTVAKKDLGVYETNKAYDISTDVWDGLSQAKYPKSLRDANVKPEGEASFELGTNFRFYNNRLEFDYTYFTRLRYDRLTTASISQGSGLQSIVTNIDEELRQKGMEFTVRGTPIKSDKFSWDASVNVSYWHWYYDKLDEDFSSNDPRIKKGARVDQYFMTDWMRTDEGKMIYNAGLPIKNKFQTVMGHRDPKYIVGFTNDFTYNNFSLHVGIDGRIGGLMYSWTEQAMWNSGSHPDSDNKWRYDEVVNGLNNYVADGVKVVSGEATFDPYGNLISDTREYAPNDVAVSYQSFIGIYNENPWDHDARQNILDASFIKLREVGLNYKLPKSFVEKLHIQNASIGVIGQNLWMWTKEFEYSDPDRGKENLNSPTSRYLGFNIDITL
ncbi:SusC/RagA family TonB-linked outer membrane protein [Puteibacter caeruleilacunae]|nr:SusC/RagA family TonB-linked outer membrane protein [Puteibacter caeruleilacunae]